MCCVGVALGWHNKIWCWFWARLCEGRKNNMINVDIYYGKSGFLVPTPSPWNTHVVCISQTCLCWFSDILSVQRYTHNGQKHKEKFKEEKSCFVPTWPNPLHFANFSRLAIVKNLSKWKILVVNFGFQLGLTKSHPHNKQKHNHWAIPPFTQQNSTSQSAPPHNTTLNCANHPCCATRKQHFFIAVLSLTAPPKTI